MLIDFEYPSLLETLEFLSFDLVDSSNLFGGEPALFLLGEAARDDLVRGRPLAHLGGSLTVVGNIVIQVVSHDFVRGQFTQFLGAFLDLCLLYKARIVPDIISLIPTGDIKVQFWQHRN